MEDFIVKYSSHLEFSRHTTIPDVHESARDVLKAWSGQSTNQFNTSTHTRRDM